MDQGINDMRPAEVPTWILQIISDPHQNHRKDQERNDGSSTITIPTGQRNVELTSFAGVMRRKGMVLEEIDHSLQMINKNRCCPALSAKEVRIIAESISSYKPSSSYRFSDIGNANRLVTLYGHMIRYCPQKKGWFIWNGKFWEEDESYQIIKFAEWTVRQMREEAHLIRDKEQKKKFNRHVLKSENLSRLRAMIELSKGKLSINLNDFDSNHWLFNCLNGTIDLKTGELWPHRSDDFISRIVPIEYNPQARCPRWLSFLNQIMDGKESLTTYLQRSIGYTLTGITSEQVIFLLVGVGANGKSTFLSVIRLIMDNYGKQTDFETFLMKNNNTVRNDLARLKGARFVCATEVDVGKRLSEPVIKQVTGGDTITARFLFREYFEFQPTFKIFLAANSKPIIRGSEHAIWRRIRLIPFDVTIPEQDRDQNLIEGLSEELHGVLAWAVQGCRRWRRYGLGLPEEIETATNEYRNDMDIIGDFLTECCIVEPENIIRRVLVNSLYDSYIVWCSNNSEDRIKKHLFNKLIQERGLRKERATSDPNRGRYHWFGISIGSFEPRGGDEDGGLSTLM